MKLKRRTIRRHWKIKDRIYTVQFRRKMKHGLRGHCDGEFALIEIHLGMDPKETYRTLIHELLHAIEFEYDLHFPHHLIYKLEEPLLEAMIDNFIEPSKWED